MRSRVGKDIALGVVVILFILVAFSVAFPNRSWDGVPEGSKSPYNEKAIEPLGDF